MPKSATDGASMEVKDILSSHFVAVNTDDHLSTLLGKLRVLDELAAVVMEDGKYIGMADKRKFLRSRLDAKSMKVRRVVTKFPTLTLNMDLHEAGRLFYACDAHTLPVLDGKKVVGVVHSRDVLKALKPEIKDFQIADVSSNNMFVLDGDEFISKAINRFREKSFDHVPIVDKKGKLIGIVATTDLLEKYYAHPPSRENGPHQYGASASPIKEFDYSHLPIRNEMSMLVHTLLETDPLAKAIDRMIEEHMSSLIVVRDGKPVSIVTIKDILRAHESVGAAAPKGRKANLAKRVVKTRKVKAVKQRPKKR